jgi:hypothetical protein
MSNSKRNSVFDNLFAFFLVAVLALFLGAGYYFRSCRSIAQVKQKIESSAVRAQFVIKEAVVAHTEKPVLKKQVPQQIIEKKKVEPIDLSEHPVMAQAQDNVEKQLPNTPVVRRVYGLRKVYSTGLGSGGNLSQAVIGKLGNTLNTQVDTFTAQKEDIRGQVVSTTTITTVPKFVKMVKPQYSKEMLENKTEGVVKIKALIDIDGKVKKALIESDLGFDSGAQAVKATMEMEFTPAMVGIEPVAVWIVIPIRFVIIS